MVAGPDVDYRFRNPQGEWQSVPAYSTDIAAAWQVVERLAALGWEASVTRWVQQPGVTPHTSCYLERNEPETGILLETYEATAEVQAPALAICRAALGVVGAE